MTARKSWVLTVMAMMLFAVVSAQATSHVRIVRLSYDDGNVQMSRAPGQSLERAILNSPIVEGSSVVTGSDGLAEVEFENNSTMRLGEATDVNFRQLLINDAGEMINEVEFVRGTMYFDTRSGKNNIYRVIAADHTFVVPRNSQVRFMMNGDQVEVAVLNGEAQLQNSAELVTVKKNNTLRVDATIPAGFTTAKGVDNLPLDRWNSERAAYQTVYAYNNTGYGSFGVPKLGGFGYQDLAYYGGFMTVPGYGLAWQPYGVSSWMGWDPYTSGAWAFTPGLGYTWASAYPWGWLPYHYGSWAYSSGLGWFWVPGNALNNGGAVTNWQVTAPVVKGPAGYSAPVPPTTLVNAPKPVVLVGLIGRAPAFIPGGPVPPDFRSVIIDHSGITGMTAPTTGGNGSGGASAHNSRSFDMTGANAASTKGSTFAAPGTGSSAAALGQTRSAGASNRSGHVFVVPAAPTWASEGYVAPWTPGVSTGHGSWAPVQSSGSTSRATTTGAAAHSNPK